MTFFNIETTCQVSCPLLFTLSSGCHCINAITEYFLSYLDKNASHLYFSFILIMSTTSTIINRPNIYENKMSYDYWENLDVIFSIIDPTYCHHVVCDHIFGSTHDHKHCFYQPLYFVFHIVLILKNSTWI